MNAMIPRRKNSKTRELEDSRIPPPGTLIVIEGTDGSGKTTQADLLIKALKKAGKKVKLISFPRYGHPAAYFEEQYLSGAFGKTDEIDIHAASLFYTLDRYQATPQIKKWLREGNIVVTNRYTTSSMIHHSPGDKKLPQYLKWLADMEWKTFAIPKPDLVLFLDVPPQVSLKLARQRSRQDKSRKMDMVEKNKAYTIRSYEKSSRVARLQKWTVISCTQKARILGKEQIAATIWQRVEFALQLP